MFPRKSKPPFQKAKCKTLFASSRANLRTDDGNAHLRKVGAVLFVLRANFKYCPGLLFKGSFIFPNSPQEGRLFKGAINREFTVEGVSTEDALSVLKIFLDPAIQNLINVALLRS